MKNKILISALVLSLIWVSGVSARCMYQETEPKCSISGTTQTSSCAEWSDTSTWQIPVAYEGSCKTTVTLNAKTQKAISNIMYKYLDKKDFIESETDEHYTITNTGKKYIQDALFPAIQKLITQEIKKTSPNHTKIAIYNHLVQLVWYDYYMSK